MKKNINYIGISKNLPKNIKYFKEDIFTTMIPIKSHNIDEIISISLDHKIVSTKIINTDIRVSNEGQRLTGKKFLIELNIIFRIKYTSSNIKKYIYVLNYKTPKVIYIVLPTEVNNESINTIIRKNKFKIDFFVEDIYAQIRENNIYIKCLNLTNFNLSS